MYIPATTTPVDLLAISYSHIEVQARRCRETETLDSVRVDEIVCRFRINEQWHLIAMNLTNDTLKGHL